MSIIRPIRATSTPKFPITEPPWSGVYYIRIRDATGYGGSTAGTYSFKITNKSYDGFAPINSGLCTDKYEPDGLPGKRV
jgi:hypothetical protein